MSLGSEFLLLVRGTADGIVDVTGNHTISNSGDGETTGALVGDENSGPFANSRGLVFTNDYLSIATSSMFNFYGLSEFTIDGWFREDGLHWLETGSSIYYGLIMGYFSATGYHRWYMQIKQTSTVKTIEFTWYPTGYYTSRQTILAELTVSIGTWFHYAIVKNGDDYKVFINGVEVVSVTNSSAFYDSDVPIKIGSARAGTWVMDFNGAMAELTIRNIAVSSTVFPPTKPYGAISGKNLIDGFDGRIIV